MKQYNPFTSEKEKLNMLIEELKEKFSTLAATDFQYEYGMINNQNAIHKRFTSAENGKHSFIELNQ